MKKYILLCSLSLSFLGAMEPEQDELAKLSGRPFSEERNKRMEELIEKLQSPSKEKTEQKTLAELSGLPDLPERNQQMEALTSLQAFEKKFPTLAGTFKSKSEVESANPFISLIDPSLDLENNPIVKLISSLGTIAVPLVQKFGPLLVEALDLKKDDDDSADDIKFDLVLLRQSLYQTHTSLKTVVITYYTCFNDPKSDELSSERKERFKKERDDLIVKGDELYESYLAKPQQTYIKHPAFRRLYFSAKAFTQKLKKSANPMCSSKAKDMEDQHIILYPTVKALFKTLQDSKVPFKNAGK